MILPPRAGGGGGNTYPVNKDSGAQRIRIKSIYHLKQGLVGSKHLTDGDTTAECRSDTSTTVAASPARHNRLCSEDIGAMMLGDGVEAGGVHCDHGAGVAKGGDGAGVVMRARGGGVVSLAFGRDAAAARLCSMSVVPAVCFGRGENGKSSNSEEPRGAKVHEVLLSSSSGEGQESALLGGSMVRVSLFWCDVLGVAIPPRCPKLHIASRTLQTAYYAFFGLCFPCKCGKSPSALSTVSVVQSTESQQTVFDMTVTVTV